VLEVLLLDGVLVLLRVLLLLLDQDDLVVGGGRGQDLHLLVAHGFADFVRVVKGNTIRMNLRLVINSSH
jgi:hypothetical protein